MSDVCRLTILDDLDGHAGIADPVLAPQHRGKQARAEDVGPVHVIVVWGGGGAGGRGGSQGKVQTCGIRHVRGHRGGRRRGVRHRLDP